MTFTYGRIVGENTYQGGPYAYESHRSALSFDRRVFVQQMSSATLLLFNRDSLKPVILDLKVQVDNYITLESFWLGES